MTRAFFAKGRLARHEPTPDGVPSTTPSPTTDMDQELAARVTRLERLVVALAGDLLDVAVRRREIALPGATADAWIRGHE